MNIPQGPRSDARPLLLEAQGGTVYLTLFLRLVFDYGVSAKERR